MPLRSPRRGAELFCVTNRTWWEWCRQFQDQVVKDTEVSVLCSLPSLVRLTVSSGEASWHVLSGHVV